MSEIQIQTMQNIAIDYRSASIGERILARLMDGFIQIVILLAILLGVSLGPMKSWGGGGLFLILVPYLGILFYDFLFESFLNGQTPGKKIMRIKVVRLDGQSATIGNYLLRWLIGLIEIVAFGGSLALLVLIFSRKGQRIGDLAAGTTVIKEQTSVRLEDTVLKQLEAEYETVFPEAARLSDEDARLIQETLQNMRNKNATNGIWLVTRARKGYEQKLGIRAEMDSQRFLETLLKDYNHIHGKVNV